MTAGRYRLAARRHAGHVWHVEDRATELVDVIAFRPEGIGLDREPYAIGAITAELLARSPDALTLLERRLAKRVGLRLP